MCFSHDAKDGGLEGKKGGAPTHNVRVRPMTLNSLFVRECSTAAALAVQVTVGPDFDNRDR